MKKEIIKKACPYGHGMCYMVKPDIEITRIEKICDNALISELKPGFFYVICPEAALNYFVEGGKIGQLLNYDLGEEFHSKKLEMEPKIDFKNYF